MNIIVLTFKHEGMKSDDPKKWPTPPRWGPLTPQHMEFTASDGLLLAISVNARYHNELVFPTDNSDGAERGRQYIDFDGHELTVRTVLYYPGGRWESIYTAIP
jgi:hypothetical protein